MKDLVCPACGVVFLTAGASSRRRKFCYDQSCETQRKRQSWKQSYQKYVRPRDLDGLTPEEVEIQRRKKISNKKAGTPQSPEHSEKIRAITIKQYAEGRQSPMKGKHHRPETKEKLRRAALRQHAAGRVNLNGLTVGQSRSSDQRAEAWTDEKRMNQSHKTKRAYQEGRMEVHGRSLGRWAIYTGPNGTTRKMRSKSEVIFASDLDAQGIEWQYEPKRFDLGWSTYCPDFYLPAFDRWVEVKGYCTDTAQRKIVQFGEDHALSVVLARDLLRLKG